MGLMDVVTLPVRVTVAATQATLGIGHLASADGPLRRRGGYADRFNTLIVLADQLNKLLADPNGPVSLVNNLAAITSEERPLGRAIAPGGALDRVLAEDGVVERFTSTGGPVDRLLSEDGPVDRLLSAQGPLDRLLSEGGALDRVTQDGGVLEQLLSPGGPLDRLLSEGGALDRITQQGGVLELLLREQGIADRLLTENGFLEKLTAEGGTLDQLLRLGDVLNDLQESVEVLNRAVAPLGELANRVPNSLLRRRGNEATPQISSRCWSRNGPDAVAHDSRPSAVVQHRRAGKAATLQVREGLGGVGHRIAVRCRPDAEPFGQPQEFFPVRAGVGGHGTKGPLLEEVLVVVQRWDVGQVDARDGQYPCAVQRR